MATSDTIIHIHEDDWGMRNLYPLAARAEVTADVATAAKSGEQNRDSSGFGWTGVHVIEPPSTTYVEGGLRLANAVTVLEPIMPRVRHFYATATFGFGPGVRDLFGSYDDDAWCFGFDAGCYLYLGPKDEHVESIWFDLREGAPERASALKQAIQAIDRLVPSMIADYFWDVAISVADAVELDRYIAKLGVK